MSGRSVAVLDPPGRLGTPLPQPCFSAGLWRLADPKISLASMASIFLGACAAARDGPLSWAWLALTVAGIFFLEVAKNASGEIFDFDSGTDPAVGEADRSPFSGGKRVLVDDLLTRGQTKAIASVAYALGIAVGLAIVALREPRVLWLGLAGIGLAWFYHAPPFRLAYRGLGEIAVGLCYGPLICGGTYLVQRETIPAPVVLLSIPLGLLIAAFLWINEFPDYLADRAAGKRNGVVRLGRRRARVVFAVLLALGTAGILLLPWAGLPPAVMLGALAGIPGFAAAWKTAAHPDSTARLIPAQALTLLAFLLAAAGSGVGMLH